MLFVCVANSGRSLMAERLFRVAAEGRHEARSAGSEPGAAPHPQVLEESVTGALSRTCRATARTWKA